MLIWEDKLPINGYTSHILFNTETSEELAELFEYEGRAYLGHASPQRRFRDIERAKETVGNEFAAKLGLDPPAKG